MGQGDSAEDFGPSESMENAGKPLEVIARDTERDNYMTAQEAKEYGLIDRVIVSR